MHLLTYALRVALPNSLQYICNISLQIKKYFVCIRVTNRHNHVNLSFLSWVRFRVRNTTNSPARVNMVIPDRI